MWKFVKPFKAFLYSEKFRKHISSLICPPYDIINEKMQKELFEQSEFNYVRIVLSPFGHRHARDTLQKFISQGVIERDDDGEKKVYILSQKFSDDSGEKEVLGIFALVSINSKIFQHEETRKKVIEDRIELLIETGFNTCPIFLLSKGTNIKSWFYSLPEGSLKKIFDFSYISNEYGVEVKGTLFSCSNLEIFDEIDGKGEFLIADGHHRYNAIKHVYSQKGEEFFMAYITDENSGVFVLPILREVKGGKNILDTVLKRISEFSNSGKILNRGVFNLSEISGKELTFLQSNSFDFIFVPKDNTEAKCFDFPSYLKNSEKNHLEILHNYILKDIPISFEHDMRDALRKLERGEIECLFIPKSLSIKEIWGVVESGRILPPKSTYFWPKIPSGIVLHRTGFSNI